MTMTMKSLSVINFIRYYVDDFFVDYEITYVKNYVDCCRTYVRRIEKLYFKSSSIDDFIVMLYDEILISSNEKERKLFTGLVKEIKRLRKRGVYFS